MKKLVSFCAFAMSVVSISQCGVFASTSFSQKNVNCHQQQQEIRAYCNEIELVQLSLENLGANLLSHYSFTDYIYKSSSLDDTFDYDKEFVRIREYHETHWDQKKIEIVHKIKDDSLHRIPDFNKLQLDDIEEAKNFLRNRYQLDFSFYREGYEYRLGNMSIYLELIQYLEPTIEVIAPSREEINDLFEKIKVQNLIHQSVPSLLRRVIREEQTPMT